MRKLHQFQAAAKEQTFRLCLLLAASVLATILLSALALAGVLVAGTWAYLEATVRIEMPAGYWPALFGQRLAESLVVVTVIVAGMGIYRTFQLADGGGRLVARLAGGTRVGEGTPDASHRRLLNVVEELAVATGLRAPPVYVLEDEACINAFAAGFQPQDAAVGVTRGAIDRLTRQQLQGVVAHEFSHILHGDARLNIHLIGVLSGIQALSTTASFLLRLGWPAGATQPGGPARHPLGMILALACGVMLWPVGQIGAFCAAVVKCAVNRQREFLADASAVQYTRDPAGLREALQLLAGEPSGSHVRSAEVPCLSHLFFANPYAPWSALLETHPPLTQRIERLEVLEQAAPSHRFDKPLSPSLAVADRAAVLR
ncbi:MAG: M48 family metalloprotease [Pirellulaceae bacterium]